MVADPKWQVIANDTQLQAFSLISEEGVKFINDEDIKDCCDRMGMPLNSQIHIFGATPPISTYIYGLSVGPYCSFSDDSGFKVPMKIFCRKAKVSDADP